MEPRNHAQHENPLARIGSWDGDHRIVSTSWLHEFLTWTKEGRQLNNHFLGSSKDNEEVICSTLLLSF